MDEREQSAEDARLIALAARLRARNELDQLQDAFVSKLNTYHVGPVINNARGTRSKEPVTRWRCLSKEAREKLLELLVEKGIPTHEPAPE